MNKYTCDFVQMWVMVFCTIFCFVMTIGALSRGWEDEFVMGVFTTIATGLVAWNKRRGIQIRLEMDEKMERMGREFDEWYKDYCQNERFHNPMIKDKENEH